MRKLILSILMATVAVTPAMAERSDRSDREEARSERQQSRENRREAREERQVRTERAARVNVEAPARAEARADRRDVRQIRESRQVARQSNDGVRNLGERQQVREDRRENRQLRQSQRATPAVLRNRVPVVSNVPRPGTQPPLTAEHRRSHSNWNTNWRHNDRYDWHNWRNRHRSLFRLGLYLDPFGWGYQRYSTGWRMWPNYYRTSSFWLNDPWQYRLPYAPAGTRWVRYYDDAILVDTWSGEVVDVIYNFFW